MTEKNKRLKELKDHRKPPMPCHKMTKTKKEKLDSIRNKYKGKDY